LQAFFHHALILCLIGGVLLFAALVGAAALGEAAGFPSLDEPLAILRQRLPVIFPLHMITGGLGLILLPWIILLRRRKRLHRLLGRAGLALLLAGALSALPTALASVATPLARAGFFTQGVLTAYFLAAGFRAIQRKDRVGHRQRMLCAAALASGAIVLRLMLYCAGSLELDPKAAYAVIAWTSWGLPVSLVAMLNLGDLSDREERLRLRLPTNAYCGMDSCFWRMRPSAGRPRLARIAMRMKVRA
jgi:uncharacterized membrane protein